MHFARSFVEQAADEIGLLARHGLPAEPFPTPIEVVHLLRGLRAAVGPRDDSHQLVIESMVTALLAVLLKQFVARRYRPPAPGREPIYCKLGRAESLLHDRFDQPISIDELAQVAHLSRYHFIRSFTRFFGVPPHTYQTRLRLERAKELMGGRHTLTDIAFTVGFGSSSRFSQAFTRAFGMTPSLWRRQRKGQSCAPSARARS